MLKHRFYLIIIFILLVIPSTVLHVQGQQTATTNNQSNSTSQDNKEIIKDFTKAFNERNLTAFDGLVAQDIIENRPGVGQGIESTKGFLIALETAFPDFKTELNHILAEGDKVLVFTNTTGTHKGPFIFAPGVEPTGKVLSFQTADLYRIENGKIAEHWDVIEIMGMLLEMGAIEYTTPDSFPMPSSP